MGISQPLTTASIPMRTIDEQTWIEWRTKMGCRKAEARQLYREYLKLVQKSGGTVRMVRPRHNESWEAAYKAFIDGLPRRPTRFLAMVAESNRRRELKERVAAKRAAGRVKYRRRFNRLHPTVNSLPGD